MSGEFIAILAVGVALSGLILTSNRGPQRTLTICAARSVNSESAWRTWKACWKTCARLSPGGPEPARLGRG